MPRAIIINPEALGPSYKRGQVAEVSPDRFARWLASGWIKPEASSVPVPSEPKAAPPLPAGVRRFFPDAKTEPQKEPALAPPTPVDPPKPPPPAPVPVPSPKDLAAPPAKPAKKAKK